MYRHVHRHAYRRIDVSVDMCFDRVCERVLAYMHIDLCKHLHMCVDVCAGTHSHMRCVASHSAGTAPHGTAQHHTAPYGTMKAAFTTIEFRDLLSHISFSFL